MPSTTPKSSNGWTRVSVAALVCLFAIGCAHSPNQFCDDSPSLAVSQDTPTAADVKSRIEPAPMRVRDWEVRTVAVKSGAVEHWPLYFEDPFEDKGDGRTTPGDMYRLGWEDFLAAFYGAGRFALNSIALPVSAVVTPPWTLMESDGELSKQCLGYDHDAQRVGAKSTPACEKAAEADEMPAESAEDDTVNHA